MEKFRELEHTLISRDCRHLYASYQTAGHGLEWTKCPAVKNLYQKIILKTSYKPIEYIRCLFRNVGLSVTF